MNISQMLYLKQKRGYSYDKIAELSGVPKGTVQKIFTGVTKSPRYETLQALEKVFQDDTNAYPDKVAEAVTYGTSAMKEEEKKPGEFTVEDYYAIPDDRRVELIDGVIYDMAGPTAEHQIIGFQIGYQIESYIESKGGDCIPFVAPCDVQIECDDYTMVQPDVFILCDKSKYRYRCIYGAPDFIAEVLSKSTSRHDRQRKYIKYFDAGVREYWIVDPFKRMVTVYLFDKSLEGCEERGDESIVQQVYSFEEEVPVHIYGGDLKISFPKIVRRIEQLNPEE